MKNRNVLTWTCMAIFLSLGILLLGHQKTTRAADQSELPAEIDFFDALSWHAPDRVEVSECQLKLIVVTESSCENPNSRAEVSTTLNFKEFEGVLVRQSSSRQDFFRFDFKPSILAANLRARESLRQLPDDGVEASRDVITKELRRRVLSGTDFHFCSGRMTASPTISKYMFLYVDPNHSEIIQDWVSSKLEHCR